MNKKEEILLRASQMFMHFGLKSVTMDDLAKEMGVSKKTLYQEFADKKDLINQTLDQIFAHDIDLYKEVKQNSANAIDTLFNFISEITKKMEMVHPSIFFDLQKYYPKAWQKINDHRRNFIGKTIQQNVLQGQKEGLYRNELEPDLISSIYITITQGVITGEVKSKQEENNLIKDFKKVLSFMLYGMATEKGKTHINNICKI
ncbi:MAG: AcrR family transcriptional regulator [Psychromonas sp.]|jgi:AcrR family transcriptional regulator